MVSTLTIICLKLSAVQRRLLYGKSNKKDMIRLNCFLEISDSSLTKKAVETAVELVELSLHDKGCITYEAFGSLTSDNHIQIVETWKDDESLKAHSESEHFRRLVPELEKCGTLTLERFDF